MFKEKVEAKYRIQGEDDYSIYTDDSGQFWGSAGAGGIFYAEDTKRICIQKRSQWVNEPNTWGTWGGAIDKGEKPEEAVKREVKEEAGYQGTFELKLLHVFKKGDFRYFNYLITIPEEFEPKHGWESSDHVWTTIDELPSPLHFGFKDLLPHLKGAISKGAD